MDTINDYLHKTESACSKLFEGVDSYISILRDYQIPMFTTWVQDDETFKKEFEEWQLKNRDRIAENINRQNKFVDESLAMSTLCGAILQIAAMAIQKFSNNIEVCQPFDSVISSNSKAARFCIGRKVRGVPIALIIYAGRNQYNHMDENKLNELNKFIFSQLAKIQSFNDKNKFYIDPAFDLANADIMNYSSNITAVLDWKDYSIYKQDLIDMLG